MPGTARAAATAGRVEVLGGRQVHGARDVPGRRVHRLDLAAVPGAARASSSTPSRRRRRGAVNVEYRHPARPHHDVPGRRAEGVGGDRQTRAARPR